MCDWITYDGNTHCFWNDQFSVGETLAGLGDIWKITTVEDKLTDARVKLQNSFPYFAYLVMHLTMHDAKAEKKDMAIQTAAVDAQGNFYYHPDFIDTLTNEEIIGVYAHEVQHCVLEHCKRSLGTYDANVWGITVDLVVNDILVQNGLKIPSCGVIPDSKHSWRIPGGIGHIKDIDKKTAEDIYYELYEKLKKLGKGKGKGISCGDSGKQKGKSGGSQSGDQQQEDEKDSNGMETSSSDMEGAKGFDKHIHNNPDQDKAKKKKEQQGKDGQDGSSLGKEDININTDLKWDDLMMEAYEFAKRKGSVPAGMEKYIDKFVNPKFNWKQILYRFLTQMIPYDYNWMKPSNKYSSTGIYLPSVKRENVEVLVTIDTSGSMWWEGCLESGVSELIGLANSFQSINMDIVMCDCEVHKSISIKNVQPDDLKKLSMAGGGGTSHRPAYDWIRKNRPNTKVVINFTDGYTDFPDYEIGTTIWLVPEGGAKKKDFPFGMVLEMGRDEKKRRY